MKIFGLRFLTMCICILCLQNINAQITTIKFATPIKDSFSTTSNAVIFSGIIPQKPFGSLKINNQPVKVFNTGTFAMKVDSLQLGLNTINVSYSNKKQTETQNFIVVKTEKTEPTIANTFDIQSIQTYPENPQWLRPGDDLQIKIKATPNQKVYWNEMELFEEKPGNYSVNYIFKDQDTGKTFPLYFTLKDSKSTKFVTKKTSQIILVLASETITGHTIGKLPYMNYSFGNDRLGAAKMTYLDSLIPFEVSGKIGNNYRVRLSKDEEAYIPEGNFLLDNKSNIYNRNILSGSWRVEPVQKGDRVNIVLDARRPYSSLTEINPSRILVDIYGTISNTNWITKLQGLKVIKNIWYEQLPNHVLRVFIDLRTPQIWGYDIHYEGNNLVILVKAAPKSSSLKDLTIALDAGHGGDNLGAEGLTGTYEKNVTLQITNQLAKSLQALGAKVILTRTKDTSLSMVERIVQLKSEDPDLLVSLHCNSAENPFVQGNSTYYRYIGFAQLSEYIHKEMLQLGLEDYGNIGSFNFALNGPTNYVNALNELAFISNPEDESRLLDPVWQQKMGKATIMGIQKFLKASIPETKGKSVK